MTYQYRGTGVDTLTPDVVELTPDQAACPHDGTLRGDRWWVCSGCGARIQKFRKDTPILEQPPRPPCLYVASSWRNRHYALVLEIVRGAGAAENRPEPDFGVYDFRSADGGFSWREVDESWESWDLDAYKAALKHPAAERGWANDKGALDRATACLLVGPCGRSAHLELGFAAGRGIPTAIFLPENQEPELMYRLADQIITDPVELMAWATEQMRFPQP